MKSTTTLLKTLLTTAFSTANKSHSKVNQEQISNLNNFSKLKKSNISNGNKALPIRSFSTTASKNSGAITPLLWLIVKPLTKLSALIAGR